MKATLCSKCNQFYISGLIDPTAGNEHKKVTRFVQSIVGQNPVSMALKEMPAVSHGLGTQTGINIVIGEPKKSDTSA